MRNASAADCRRVLASPPAGTTHTTATWEGDIEADELKLFRFVCGHVGYNDALEPQGPVTRDKVAYRLER